jgi:hypothetical protein
MELSKEDLKAITEKLDIILDKLKPGNDEPYQSITTENLNSAVANATLDFPKILINRQNPYLASGYADLHEIMIKIRPILGKNGLHLAQIKKLKDGATYLSTRLWHSSGEWIESRVLLNPSKNSIESYGSHLNSMKRFEAMDILNITVPEDPFDDDGEADMKDDNEIMEGGSKLKALYDKKKESFSVINAAQYRELMKELDDDQLLAENILDKLHLRSLRDLPESRFQPTIDRIRRIKKIRLSGKDA